MCTCVNGKNADRLDEECRFPKASESSLLNKFDKNLKEQDLYNEIKVCYPTYSLFVSFCVCACFLGVGLVRRYTYEYRIPPI